MWIGVLLNDILVVEDSRFVETTLILFHPTVTNLSLTRVSSPRAKL
jgi:hypothetical protein